MVTLASWKGELFHAVLGFLPDWLQWAALGLAVLGFAVSWGVKLRRENAHGRAEVPGDAGHGQSRGADFLGPYAPQQTPEPVPQGGAEPRGADFLGAYAPGARQEGASS